MKKLFTHLALSALLLILLGACSQSGSNFTYEGAEHRNFPSFVEESPVKHVKDAYAYAADHPEQVEHIPCYCGCGPLGHTSVKSCFVHSGAGDEAELDPHGAGCEICVQIVMDTMTGKEEGKSLSEIRQGIEERYGDRYLPTDTPEPPAGM